MEKLYFLTLHVQGRGHVITLQRAIHFKDTIYKKYETLSAHLNTSRKFLFFEENR